MDEWKDGWMAGSLMAVCMIVFGWIDKWIHNNIEEK